MYTWTFAKTCYLAILLHVLFFLLLLYTDTKLASAQQELGTKATTKTDSRKTLLAKTTNPAAKVTTMTLLTKPLTTTEILPSAHDARTLYPTIITPSQTNLNVSTKSLFVPQPVYVQKPTRMIMSPEQTSITKSPITTQTVDPRPVYVQKPTRMLISPEPTSITNSPTTKQTVHPQPVYNQKQTRKFISPEPTSITNSPMTKQTVDSHSYGWTAWSHWSPCDLECRHSRYRFCMNYDSQYCPGQKSDSRDCAFPCKRK